MKKKIIFPMLLSILILTACQPASTPTAPTAAPPLQTTEAPADETAEAITPSEDTTETPTEINTTPIQDLPPFEPVVALEQIASGLTAPVDLDAPDDGSGRLFVTDQVGMIFVIDENDQRLETPLLDVRDRMVSLNGNYDERGLLGLAIHPDFAQNDRLFVYYSAPLRQGGTSGFNHTSILSEFTISQSDPNIADPASERIILQIDQPQGNHNAGAIAFGPDGYLYIPLGDGGGGDDIGTGHAEDWYAVNAGGNGQDNENNMHGSVLRIDIDNGDPYNVPADNPAISANFPEIWAYGFRNPYRMAFDIGGEQELFLGDAGQDLWEEVNIVRAGGNYGWNVREGTHCFSTADPANPNAISDCPMEDDNGNPLIDPILEFPNSRHPDGGLGATIIGGVVYRGTALPAWDGRYIFGQWSIGGGRPQGSLFAASTSEQDLWSFESVEISNREDGELGEFLLGFGQDQQGEVYALTSLSTGPSGNTGSVYRIIPPTE